MLSGRIKRLFPADPLPTWIRIALRPRPLHGVEHPRVAINVFGCGLALTTKGLAGWVAWVRLHCHKASIFNNRDATATRPAQRTVTGDAFLLQIGRHDYMLSSMLIFIVDHICQAPLVLSSMLSSIVDSSDCLGTTNFSTFNGRDCISQNTRCLPAQYHRTAIPGRG